MENNKVRTEKTCSLAVCITYYNERNLLTQALETLLTGTTIPDEILVYDDASSYPAKDYIPDNININLIRSEENHGPGYGRNLLMDQAKSQYIRFHDADDPFHPDWCKQIKKSINKYHSDIVITGLVKKGIKETYQTGFIKSLEHYPKTDNLTIMSIRWGLATQEVVFKKELGIKIGGQRIRSILPRAEDSEFYTRLTTVTQSYHLIKESLAIRRIRKNSLSMDLERKNRIEHIQDSYKMAELLFNELPMKYHQELAEMVAQNAHRAFIMGYPKIAKQGFRLANRLGPADYRYMRKSHRLLLRFLSPIKAEYAMQAYRDIVSKPLRKIIKSFDL